MTSRLISTLGRIDFRPSMVSEAAIAALDERGWASVLEDAIREGVFFAVVDRVSSFQGSSMMSEEVIDRLLDAPDPGVRIELRRRYDAARGRPVKRLAQAVREYALTVGDITVQAVGSTLADAGIDYLLFKGVVVGQHYPYGMLRDSSDVDLVVRDLAAAWHGVRRLEERGASFRFLDLGYPIEGTAVGALVGEMNGSGIDLHIAYPEMFGGTTIRADWWRDPQSVSLKSGNRVAAISREHSILLLAAHVQHDGRLRLRDVNDLAVLIKSNEVDWQRLLGYVEENGLRAVLDSLLSRLELIYPDRRSRPHPHAASRIEARSFAWLRHLAGPGRSMAALPYLAWRVLASQRWSAQPMRSRLHGVVLLALIALEQDAWWWQERTASAHLTPRVLSALRATLLFTAGVRQWSATEIPRFYFIRLERVQADTEQAGALVIQRYQRAEASSDRRGMVVTAGGTIALSPVGAFVALSYTGRPLAPLHANQLLVLLRGADIDGEATRSADR